MINIKDNSYTLTTKDGEDLTFQLDFKAMLKLEKILNSSTQATQIFLDLFKPGSDSFYEHGLTILCSCCVEKRDLTVDEFNSLFKLSQDNFNKVDEILHNLVIGFFGEDEETEKK